MAYLLNDLTKHEKRARLMAAYRRMNLTQRDVLDKTIRGLAKFPSLSMQSFSAENLKWRILL
jgi:hypothetical protein